MPPVPTVPPVAENPPVEATPPVPIEPPVESPPVPIAPPVLAKPPVPTIPPVITTPPVPGLPPTAGPPSRIEKPPVPRTPPEEATPPVGVPPPPARGASMAPPPPEPASTPDAPPVPDRPPCRPRSKAPLRSCCPSIGYTTRPPLPAEPALPRPPLSTLQATGITRVAMSQDHLFGLCIGMNLWLGYWSMERGLSTAAIIVMRSTLRHKRNFPERLRSKRRKPMERWAKATVRTAWTSRCPTSSVEIAGRSTCSQGRISGYVGS